MSKFDLESCFREPMASELDAKRALVRFNNPQKVLIYNCFNARVKAVNTVACGKGHQFRVGNHKGGTMSLIAVLRGNTTPSVCQCCKDYDGDGE